MQDLSTFNTLKEAVSKTFLDSNHASADFKSWGKEEITSFQEDLLQKVKARVSEKWFYTYFKNDPEKLPRLDMLNLLSQYVGYTNWSHFKVEHDTKKRSHFKNLTLHLLLLTLIISLITIWAVTKSHTFNFCFINDINGEHVDEIALDIKILNDSETPVYIKTDSTGCFKYETKSKTIKFVVQSPYHKTDTIIKSIDNLNNGNIKLVTDDYALMLDYYSKNSISDWKIHRKKLETIFSEDALIYQVFPNNIGIELFTKDEFINKLTVPTQSLKRMKIMGKTYVDGKIVKLKFIIQ